MFKVNTKTQLITFFLFALLVNVWHQTILLLLMTLLLIVIIYLNNQHYFRLTYRLKWFYLVMFIVFAWNTPGEYVATWPFALKPTYEGVSMGLEQVLRIATMLAFLSMILMQNTKQQLISALYFMMRPLSHVGLDVKRFAVRLWLTLHYVELQQSNTQKLSFANGLSQYLKIADVDEEHQALAIVFENQQQTVADYVVLSAMVLLLVIVRFGWGS